MNVEKLKDLSNKDNFMKLIGIEVLEIREGLAKVRLKFGDNILNIFQAGHGGAIYTLADVAFQLACNASDEIEIAVALSTDMNFIKKVNRGETLLANAKVISSTKRTSITEIKIINEANDLVAIFNGLAYLKRYK